MVYHEGARAELAESPSTRTRAQGSRQPDEAAQRGARRSPHHELPRQLCAWPFWTFGNGAHVRMSIWDMETNKNLMYDAGANPEEQFSQMGRYFIGGLLKHTRPWWR